VLRCVGIVAASQQQGEILATETASRVRRARLNQATYRRFEWTGQASVRVCRRAVWLGFQPMLDGNEDLPLYSRSGSDGFVIVYHGRHEARPRGFDKEPLTAHGLGKKVYDWFVGLTFEERLAMAGLTEADYVVGDPLEDHIRMHCEPASDYRTLLRVTPLPLRLRS
jgi:hypothetical protein